MKRVHVITTVARTMASGGMWNMIFNRRGRKKRKRGKKRRCDVVPQGKMRSPNEEERRLSIHIV